MHQRTVKAATTNTLALSKLHQALILRQLSPGTKERAHMSKACGPQVVPTPFTGSSLTCAWVQGDACSVLLYGFIKAPCNGCLISSKLEFHGLNDIARDGYTAFLADDLGSRAREFARHGKGEQRAAACLSD